MSLRTFWLLVILGLSLILTHLFNSTFWLTLLLAISITSFFVIGRTRFLKLSILAFLLPILLFALTFSTIIIGQNFPIDPSDTSWQVSNIEQSASSPSFSFISGWLLIALFVVGLFDLFLKISQTRKISLRQITILSWLLLTLLMLNQGIANYNFFASRYSDLLILPVSLLAAAGIYWLWKTTKNRTAALIVLFTVIFLIMAFYTANYFNPKNPYLKSGISQEKISELANLKSTLAGKVIISDPITMYYTISLAGAKRPFDFAHTSLTRDKILELPFTQSIFLSDVEDAYRYAKDTQVDYLIISSNTVSLLEKKVDFTKFSNTELFKKTYQSRQVEEKLDLENSNVPYFAIFAVQ